MSEFPLPYIPALRPGDVIDMADVAAGLVSYVKYPSIATGDVIHANWRGCMQNKQVVDALNLFVVVDMEFNYDEELGVRLVVPTPLVGPLDQGWAFYSYIVERQQVMLPESLRQFAFMGIRPPLPVDLPVVQLREARGLLLDPRSMGALGVTALAPPYLAMQAGDRVTLHWRGYFDDELNNAVDLNKTLVAADIGKPLQWLVPSAYVHLTDGGQAHLSYSIRYRDGGEVSQSGLQVFRVAREEGSLLPVLSIEGHDGGAQLDPLRFPNGLTMRIAPYADIRVDDQMLLHWLGARDSFSTVKSLRIDTSTLDSTILVAHLEAHWLEAAAGERISLWYQFARAGSAGSGAALELQVRRPLDLGPPIVEDATAEGGNDEHKGMLEASDATFGARVDVPQSVPIAGGDLLEMHWQGHPEGGRYIATTPIPGSGQRGFHIPPSAIAANMSHGEAGRFPVFYRLTQAGEAPQDSRPFHLRINPLPSGVYPNIQCTQAQSDNSLSLSQVPGGATLYLDGWTFIAEGQLLTLEAVGVSASGAVSHTIRNAQRVTATELANNRVHATLVRSFLLSLLLNQPFYLKARASFDNGDTWTSFRDTILTLKA